MFDHWRTACCSFTSLFAMHMLPICNVLYAETGMYELYSVISLTIYQAECCHSLWWIQAVDLYRHISLLLTFVCTKCCQELRYSIWLVVSLSCFEVSRLNDILKQRLLSYTIIILIASQFQNFVLIWKAAGSPVDFSDAQVALSILEYTLLTLSWRLYRNLTSKYILYLWLHGTFRHNLVQPWLDKQIRFNIYAIP